MKPLTARQLEDQLHALFAQPLDDDVLRERITGLSTSPHFLPLVAVWGPPLYRRNRAMFLPIILLYFHDYAYPWGVGVWRAWKYQEALEQWLADADRLGDVQLFQRLLRWKLASCYWRPRRAWERELVERFRNATKPHECAELLKKYDLGYQLTDATALALYDLDAETAREFVSTRVEVHGRKGKPSELRERARQAGDEKLHRQLYRLQVSAKQWREDALALCDRVADPGELCRKLEEHHPNLYGNDLGAVYVELARRRGADVLPYLQSRLPGWSIAPWYKTLRDLAKERGWTEFHATLVRVCADQQEYQAAVSAALADTAIPEEEVIARVYQLTGISGSRFGARAFDESIALALYRRFPDLARGPFRRLIYLPNKSKDHALLRAVLDADDETMIDYLAMQAVTCNDRGEDLLADHYAALRDRPEEFARRAVAVLSQMPAYSIGDAGYQQFIRTNRLARLLLERSAELHLANTGLLRDMLEAPGIFVQFLALRALGRDDDRARAAAAENLDLLLPMFLRPLHRRTRLVALQAIANAATTEDRARAIVDRARDSLELPDRRYPREQVIGLVGKLLARWPSLRTSREHPVTYGATPA